MDAGSRAPREDEGVDAFLDYTPPSISDRLCSADAVEHLVRSLPNIRSLSIKELSVEEGLTPHLVALATAWPNLEQLEVQISRHIRLGPSLFNDRIAQENIQRSMLRQEPEHVRQWNVLLDAILRKYCDSLRMLTLIDNCKWDSLLLVVCSNSLILLINTLLLLKLKFCPLLN